MGCFTAEELAELAAFDAAIDAEPLRVEDYRAAKIRDRKAKVEAIAVQRGITIDEAAAWMERHKEHKRAYHQRPEVKARKAKWNAEHRDEILAQSKVYYQENREYRLAWQREYYAAHRAEEYARQRQRDTRNREKYAAEQARIREWRVAQGMRQSDMAEMLGVTAAAISAWERGIVRAPWDKLAAVGCK